MDRSLPPSTLAHSEEDAVAARTVVASTVAAAASAVAAVAATVVAASVAAAAAPISVLTSFTTGTPEAPTTPL